MSFVLLSAIVFTTSASALPVDAEPARGIALSGTEEARTASLLQGLGLAGSWKPSASAPLRLTDRLRFERGAWPLPLDEGGGVSENTRKILALVLGFFPGFGLGHLVAGDEDGFVLFLIIDLALVATGSILGAFVGGGLFWALGSLVWVVVHVVQALDAYAEAGGERIVQRTREKAVVIAASDQTRPIPVTTTRVLRLEF